MRSRLVALALFATALAACTGPLDDGLGRSQSALSANDPGVTGLPDCRGLHLPGKISVLFVDDGSFVAESDGVPVCHDDGDALIEAGADRADVDAAASGDQKTVDGTPLPAATADESTDGTPLPAKH
jgi:hypothetical protein